MALLAYHWFRNNTTLLDWLDEAVVAVLLVGLISLGIWFLKRRREIHGIKRIYGMSGVVWFDYEIGKQSSWWMYRLREVFGPQFMACVHTAILGRQVRDRDLRCLTPLKTLRDLDLSHTRVTSDGMTFLRRLVNLTSLNLTGTKVTDEGLEQLSQMTQLQTLRLRACPVTDGCIQVLAKLRSLDVLDLGQTNIGDASLGAICEMKWLRELNAQETLLSDDARRKLKKSLRKTRVVLD